MIERCAWVSNILQRCARSALTKSSQRARARILRAVAVLVFASPVFAVDLAKEIDFNIPPQALSAALITFSHQAKVQVIVSEDLGKQTTQGITGQHSISDALTKLLDGTGLNYRISSDTSITIGKPAKLPVSQSRETGPASSSAPQRRADNSNSQDPPSEQTLRLAQVGQTNPGSQSLEPRDQSAAQPVTLQEVVVTAQKRIERLQDVPVPVSAISADTLTENNQTRLQDYFSKVPGLTVTPGDYHGSPMLSIRGITTGGGFLQPTVGIVVDDIPYGSSTGIGGGFQSPDIDPSDLARVEVLRGPQGTLYGASSIGGLLKYVTIDPSTDKFSGRVQAGVNAVHQGDGAGGNFRGAVNIPLTDTFAIRVSGFARRDPGYVDNISTGEKGVNQTDAAGGRLSALWRPSELWSLKLSALYQHTKVNGSPDVDVQPGLGDLQQNNLAQTGRYDTTFQAYNAIVNVKLNELDFVSLSGYNVNAYTDSVDFTPALGKATLAQFGVPWTPLHDSNRTKKFTQEFRLANASGETFEWLIGAFYTYEDSQLVQDILVADAAGNIINLWNHSAPPTTFREYAGFADLTWHITQKFDVQLGGRESGNRQTYDNTDYGPYATKFLHLSHEPFVFPEILTKENSFTYLATPRFKFSEDLMTYARLASGYRPGGPNSNSVVFNTPSAFKPDKTLNYEVGMKGNVLDRRLTFDASVYYIDWKDIQLNLTDPVTKAGYRSNASHAKSQGVELSMETRPISGLTASAWVTYNDAELTAALPTISGAYGRPGDRLPYSSRFSSNVSLDEEFGLIGDLIGFVGGSVSYVGDRMGVFRSVPLRQTFPGYVQTDFNTGVRHDSWSVNAYCTNVTDRRGVLTGGLGTSPNPLAFNYIQPRTVGLSITTTF